VEKCLRMCAKLQAQAAYHLGSFADGKAALGGLGFRLRLEAVQVVNGPLRVGGCGKDRAVVLLHDVQPVADIRSVVLTDLRRQLQVGTPERGAQLGYKLLAGIAFIAPRLAAEVPLRSRAGSRAPSRARAWRRSSRCRRTPRSAASGCSRATVRSRPAGPVSEYRPSSPRRSPRRSRCAARD
jgi:hypothetical protein